jgi:phosphoenolpyruvate carboxylase
MPNAHLDADKDAPLRYDIRLLGRILGETIRAQEGERTFDTIERIRLTALRFHRDADPSAARELQNNIREGRSRRSGKRRSSLQAIVCRFWRRFFLKLYWQLAAATCFALQYRS